MIVSSFRRMLMLDRNVRMRSKPKKLPTPWHALRSWRSNGSARLRLWRHGLFKRSRRSAGPRVRFNRSHTLCQTSQGLDRLQSKFTIAAEEDTEEMGVLMGSFDCTYLGSVPTSSPGGPDVVAHCMVAIKVGPSSTVICTR